MRQRRLVDTNIIVRHLVSDHEKHAKIADDLFAACDRGEITLVILPVVLAECLYVLKSFYQHGRADVARVLSVLIESPGIELSDLTVHIDALGRYAKSKLHYVDCVIAAHAVAEKIPVATFDADFKKFTDVRVEID